MLPTLGQFLFGLLDRIADAKASEFLGSRRNFTFNGRHLLLPLRRGEVVPIFRLRLLHQDPKRLKDVIVGEQIRWGVALYRSPYLRDRGLAEHRFQRPKQPGLGRREPQTPPAGQRDGIVIRRAGRNHDGSIFRRDHDGMVIVNARVDPRIGYVRGQVPAELHDTPPRLSLSTGLTGLPAAAMTAPTFSVAARRGSSCKWLYLAVVRGLVCPSSAPISGSDAPPETNCEA